MTFNATPADWLLLATVLLNPVVWFVAIMGGRRADQFAKVPIVAIAAGAVGALTFWIMWSVASGGAELPFRIAGFFIIYAAMAFAIAAVSNLMRARSQA